jgi:hypothetical protein
MAATETERRLEELERSFSDRIARLEEEVSRLALLEQDAPRASGAAWWKKVVGVFQGDEEFEEAARLGRAYRESLRPKDEGSGEEST